LKAEDPVDAFLNELEYQKQVRPNSIGTAALQWAKDEIKRLRMFLGEIAAMGPADEEWDADTLEDAVALAKRALGDNG